MSRNFRLGHERPSESIQCQNCLNFGHYTYQCTKKRAYLYRPSSNTLFSTNQLFANQSLDKAPAYHPVPFDRKRFRLVDEKKLKLQFLGSSESENERDHQSDAQDELHSNDQICIENKTDINRSGDHGEEILGVAFDEDAQANLQIEKLELQKPPQKYHSINPVDLPNKKFELQTSHAKVEDSSQKQKPAEEVKEDEICKTKKDSSKTKGHRRSKSPQTRPRKEKHNRKHDSQKRHRKSSNSESESSESQLAKRSRNSDSYEFSRGRKYKSKNKKSHRHRSDSSSSRSLDKMKHKKNTLDEKKRKISFDDSSDSSSSLGD